MLFRSVALGIKKGDAVTICLPNVPQAVYLLYALDRIGAVASMIHPLSAVTEIIYYLKEVDSHTIVTLDQFYDKIAEVEKEYELTNVLITTAAEELGFIKSTAFKLINKNHVDKKDPRLVTWRKFLANGKNVNLNEHIVHMSPDETATQPGVVFMIDAKSLFE